MCVWASDSRQAEHAAQRAEQVHTSCVSGQVTAARLSMQRSVRSRCTQVIPRRLGAWGLQRCWHCLVAATAARTLSHAPRAGPAGRGGRDARRGLGAAVGAGHAAAEPPAAAPVPRAPALPRAGPAAAGLLSTLLLPSQALSQQTKAARWFARYLCLEGSKHSGPLCSVRPESAHFMHL